MILVMAASPLIAKAASRDFVPERLTARRTASPTASASTIAFSLIELGGVGSAAYDSTRNPRPFSTCSMSFTEDVVMSSPSNVLVLRLENTNFPFQRNRLG